MEIDKLRSYVSPLVSDRYVGLASFILDMSANIQEIEEGGEFNW